MELDDAELSHEADELSVPHPDLQGLAEVVSRPAGAPGRAGHGLSLRALGRDARPAARARLHPGRRAHLLHARSRSKTRSVGCMDFALAVLHTYGFDQYQVELSTWDPNDRKTFIGSDEQWELAQALAEERAGAAQHPVQADPRRSRVLRAEDRHQAGGRHRPPVAALHRAVRLQPARSASGWSTSAKTASATSR